jgi:phosphatidylglycerophosphate synthase
MPETHLEDAPQASSPLGESSDPEPSDPEPSNPEPSPEVSAGLGPLLVDARSPAARERFLGLRHYQRALLAARHAGCSPLHVLVRPEDLASFRGFASDPRLGEVPLDLHTNPDDAPEVPRVDGAVVIDKAAAAAIARGEDPVQAGIFLPPDASARSATLLRSLENPCDGFVDTWFNRSLSRLMTRALVGTRISPNTVTVISFLVGLIGVALIATRRWELALLGALVFQLSAAIDCVDGEIARLTYRFSPLGARLDLALDNVVHVALFATLGWAAVPLLGAPLALGLGAMAALGGVISFGLVYRLNFGDERGHTGRVRRILDRVTNRDFSVLVIAAALASRFDLLLGAIALGTHLFWVVLLWVAREDGA